VNVAVPWGEVLIGLGVIVGLLTRLAAFWGAFMMLMFYLGNWDISHGYINGDFAYMLVFLSVAAFGAGRILGLDAYVRRAVRDRRSAPSSSGTRGRGTFSGEVSSGFSVQRRPLPR